MAITYSIGANPKWYFVDQNGEPLAGGKFNTYSSLNNSLRKAVYADPAGNFPYTNPIIIDADGTAGPFWFEFDSLNPDDGYLIIVTDANNVPVWTVDDYFANTGGGGGNVTVDLNIDNLIVNNVMYRHSDNITQVPGFSIIAPSNHSGFSPNSAVAGVNPSSDICFLKATTGETDAISFGTFTLGDEPIVNDSSPVEYFNYTCTVADALQTVRCLQFPLFTKVQNLSGQDVVGSFWVRANGATPNQEIKVKWFQYFGDGVGASAPVETSILTYTIATNNVWVKVNIASTVPDVSGKTLGAPNTTGPNDALFIQFQFQDPPRSVCNIDFTKPTLYPGNSLPALDFESYDEIDSFVNSPRTGDVRISMNSFTPFGWVPCNDGVLSSNLANGGGAITAPTGIPVARKNVDSYPLFVRIWEMTSGYASFAPIYNSAGVLDVRGATAIADFSAGKQLQLTRMLGRVLAGANPTFTASQTFIASAVTDQLTVADATQFPTGTPVLLTNTGGALPTFALTNVPAIYYSVFVNATTISLASSVDEAQVGLILDITAAGAGVNTIQTALGTYYGEGKHIQTSAEVGSHTHTFSDNIQFTPSNVAAGGTPTYRQDAGGTALTINANTPAGTRFNVMQPTAFMNVFLKL